MRLVAKHAQVGYQTPGQRPGCRNCTHCDLYRPDGVRCSDAPSYRCVEHDLEVTSGGICPDHVWLGYRNGPPDDRTLPLEFPQLGEPA